MKKLPKKMFIQSYLDGDGRYYISDLTAEDAADTYENLKIDSYVGIYELKGYAKVSKTVELRDCKSGKLIFGGGDGERN